MEIKDYSGILLLFLCMLDRTSCDKDGEIDINQLVGTWDKVYEPGVVAEGGVEYTFNADKTCQIYIYDILSDHQVTENYTYIISYDDRLLTIYDGDKYIKQYHITKLTSKDMHWENASPNDRNEMEMKFRKIR